MTFQHSVARFLLDPKYLNKSVIHKFRTRNIPSVELNTLFSVHNNNQRAFSIGSCLPSLFSKTFYDSICLHVAGDEPLKRKTFNKQVIWSISKRNKGHSKWQNIQHIKAANDAKNSQRNHRYVQQIITAIKENGNQTDLKANNALARVVAEAQAQNMPKATIENAIKRAKTADASVESLLEVRGPGNTFIIVETFAKHKKLAISEVQSKLNKARAGILDQGMINTFERRGVIIAKASGDITLDTAEEDAIEFGAEEVMELDSTDDGSKIFQFLSSPMDFSAVKETMSGKELKGSSTYEIISANVDYISIGNTVDLDSQKEEDAFKKLIDHLNDCTVVSGVYHNCNIDV